MSLNAEIPFLFVMVQYFSGRFQGSDIKRANSGIMWRSYSCRNQQKNENAPIPAEKIESKISNTSCTTKPQQLKMIPQTPQPLLVGVGFRVIPTIPRINPVKLTRYSGSTKKLAIPSTSAAVHSLLRNGCIIIIIHICSPLLIVI